MTAGRRVVRVPFSGLEAWLKAERGGYTTEGLPDDAKLVAVRVDAIMRWVELAFESSTWTQLPGEPAEIVVHFEVSRGVEDLLGAEEAQ